MKICKILQNFAKLTANFADSNPLSERAWPVPGRGPRAVDLSASTRAPRSGTMMRTKTSPFQLLPGSARHNSLLFS